MKSPANRATGATKTPLARAGKSAGLQQRKRIKPQVPLPSAPGPACAAAASAERAALAWIHGARFATTASRLDQLPVGDVPEIAFVGRSNAGKSTAINALAQHKRLAFASRTPGRTQHINLFALGPPAVPDAYLADLPGYGYAAVERQAKWRWQQVMADYLASRRNLCGVVLMVDSRLGFTDLDLALLDLLAARVVSGEVRLLVLLTKCDKLNRRASQAALLAAASDLQTRAGEASDIGVALFSSLTRQGLGDAAQTLHGWIHPPLEGAAGAHDGARDSAAHGT